MLARLFIQLHILGVFHEPDDFHVQRRTRFVIRRHMLADRVGAAKKIMGKRLIHNHDSGAAGIILLGEIPAGDEGNSKSSEISKRNYGGIGTHVLVLARLITLHPYTNWSQLPEIGELVVRLAARTSV